MDGQQRVSELLEQILETSCTPEEACLGDPDLLPIVRERLKRLRLADAWVAEAFPAMDEPSGVSHAFLRATAGSPPLIPGYDIHERVGLGGMGVVYRARHLRLNRNVAIKLLLAGGLAGARELARFKREAEAIAALQHPNIVQVYDAGEHEGFPYFTMEFAEGGSLARKLEGALQPVRRAAESLVTLARAVHAAHERGIVHRDLKPGNVLLTGDGTLKIADFGLAHRLDGNQGAMPSQASAHAGTPSYMSPEQVLGTPGANHPPVDVYALGAILYELVTGRPPFRAGTPVETQRAVIEEEPTRPTRLNSKIPRDLETICLKCLQKDPASRYATAADLAADLERFLKHEPIQARPTGWLEIGARWVHRRPAAAGLAAAVALLLAIGVAGVWMIFQQRRAMELRQSETDEEVRGVLQRARGPLEDGWQAVALEQLSDALAEGNRAVEIARRGGATPTVQQEAESFRADADGRIRRARKDRALLEALLDVSAPRELSDDARSEANRMLVLAQPDLDEQCLAAFRHWGVDVDGLAETDVVEQLRQEPDVVVHELIAALDTWMLARRQRKRPEGEWRRLFRVADQLDRSDERRQLRMLLVEDSPPAQAASGLRELRARIDPRTEPALTVALLAQACEAAGDVAAAEEILRSAVTSRPEQAVLLHALGRLLERQPSRIEEAIGYYRAARSQRPTLGIVLSGALARAGRAAESEEVLQSLALLQPHNPVTHFCLAGALDEQGKFGEAEAAYRKAIELKPDLAEAHHNLGTVLRVLEKHGEAEAAYRKAIELKPGSAVAYFNLGNILNDMGRHDEAEAASRKAIELKADFGEAYTGLGDALEPQGRLDEAEAAYRQAIELKPDFAPAHLHLGNVLHSQGKPGESEAALRKAIELDPALAEAHHNLGNMLQEQHQYREAEAAYRRAIKLKPGFAEPYYCLGNALCGESRYAEAEGLCRRAIELKPELTPAYYVLGTALSAQAKFQEAASTLEKCADLSAGRAPLRRLAQQELEENRRFAALDLRLSAILSGAEESSSAAEQIEFARLCIRKKLCVSAARLYADALAREPQPPADSGTSWCYDAACAAALAGCGRGDDRTELNDDERARWRAQARRWLADALDRRRAAPTGDAEARELALRQLRHWLTDSDLSGLRDPDSLATLPPAERDECLAIWSEVDELLARLQGGG